MHRSERLSTVPARLLGVLLRLIVAAYCLTSVAALTWTVYTSLKSDRDLFGRGPWALPETWHPENYTDVWSRANIGNYFFNSAYISVVATVVGVLVSAMAAYVIARIEFRASQPILFYFIAGMMVPGFLYIVPLYFMLVNTLKLGDNHLGLILLYIAGSLPFNIFILTGFFKTLPIDLEEAATIDGASPNAVFWQIMLPLARPGLLTVAIFNFITHWNEFFWSLVLLQDKRLFTISRGLFALYLESQYQARWTILFAGLLIAMLPVLVVFALLQDRITEGLTVGALKG